MLKGAIPTVYVSDHARAVRWYTETLGFRLAVNIPGLWAAVDTGGGMHIGIHPATDANVPGARGGISIGIHTVEPIEQVVSALQDRGVEFRGSINDEGTVKLAFFGDPDGNDLYLCETVRAYA